MANNSIITDEQPFDKITYKILLDKYIKTVLSTANFTNNATNETLIVNFHDLLKVANLENYPQFMREMYIKNVLVVVFYTLIIIISLFGNLLVCNVILSKRCMRYRTTNIFIVNLTISDLLVTIFTIPVTIARLVLDNWPFGSWLCICGPFIQVTSIYVSTLSMAIIAFDRYQALVSPLKRRLSHKIPKPVLLSFIWIVAGLLSLPHAVFNRQIEMFTYKSVIRCRTIYPEPKNVFKKTITALTSLTTYFIPLSITILIYVLISVKISRRVCIGEMTERQISSRIRSKAKTIKMLVIVVVAFGICWLPINLYHLLSDFYATDFNLTTFYCVHWLAMSSVCYNPFIYFWLNKYYREGIKNVLFCRKISLTHYPSAFRSFLSSKDSIRTSNRKFSVQRNNSEKVNSLKNNIELCLTEDNQCLPNENKLCRIPTLTTSLPNCESIETNL